MPKPQAAKKKASPSAKHKAGSRAGAGGAVMKVLNTVASMKARLGKPSVERKRLSFLTGVPGKSTINNALTKLRNKGWIEFSPTEVTITAKGMEKADPGTFGDVSVPTTNREHHDSVKKQFKLKRNAIALFDAIADGRTYQKTVVAATIGCTMNSTFSNLLTGLKKSSIIEFDSKTIRLTDDMFPIEPRLE